MSEPSASRAGANSTSVRASAPNARYSSALHTQTCNASYRCSKKCGTSGPGSMFDGFSKWKLY